MATSSIFTNIVIDDPQKAERFITALEASEKAKASRTKTAHAIPVLKDIDAIRQLMAKRTTGECCVLSLLSCLVD